MEGQTDSLEKAGFIPSHLGTTGCLNNDDTHVKYRCCKILESFFHAIFRSCLINYHTFSFITVFINHIYFLVPTIGVLKTARCKSKLIIIILDSSYVFYHKMKSSPFWKEESGHSKTTSPQKLAIFDLPLPICY